MKLQLWETIARTKKNSSMVTDLRYQFQGQSAISQNWFKLDPDWIEENFMTMWSFFFRGFIKNIFLDKLINIG